MKFKKTKQFLVSLAALSILALTACGSDKTAANSKSDVFSSMDTTDLAGNRVTGRTFSKNKLTLVNVWNSGCTPCVQELPILDKLDKEYAEKGVAIKGLYYDLRPTLPKEEHDEIDSILSDTNVGFQQLLLSEDMRNSNMFKEIDSIPVTYLVDSKGTIVDTLDGSRDYEGWKEVIEEGLKKVE